MGGKKITKAESQKRAKKAKQKTVASADEEPLSVEVVKKDAGGHDDVAVTTTPAAATELPFISVCTPTFNRRPFVPAMIACFQHQTYPKDKMEWIILDDGTDPIGDLVSSIPQVRYFSFDEKQTLGKKRNMCNKKARGEIILYMDDDDYYPPERCMHAVETLLAHPEALCAGSSRMMIYFKHIHKMYQFGPYGPKHSTAATFAFRKELLKHTKFNDTASVAEERLFLKDYSIPFVQLDPLKSILVFSHIQNSCDKRELLKQLPCPTITESPLTPADIVKEPAILQFFMHDIDAALEAYTLGNVEHKPDVIQEISKLKAAREKRRQEEMQQRQHLHQLQYLQTVFSPPPPTTTTQK